MCPSENSQDKSCYTAYLNHIESFLDRILFTECANEHEYIRGSQRVDYYPERIDNWDLEIEDHVSEPLSSKLDYEDALLKRLQNNHNHNLLTLIGGIGAGKTTTCRYIQRQLAKNSPHHSDCPRSINGVCCRTPVIIDCNEYTKDGMPQNIDELTTKILRKVRLGMLDEMIAEWLTASNIPTSPIMKAHGENTLLHVIRTLVVANDIIPSIAGSADSKISNLPIDDCKIGRKLFSGKCTVDQLTALHEKYLENTLKLNNHVNALTDQLSDAIAFTASLSKFYIHSCPAFNPRNLVVVDNLDALPTSYIERLIRVLHQIAEKVEGLPILVPVRPSSIGPQGFTVDVKYRYHYGPSTFFMILRKLEDLILNRPSEALWNSTTDSGTISVFSQQPSDEERAIFLFAIYIYAKIMVSGSECEGVKGDRRTKHDIRVHPNHDYLLHLTLPDEAFRSAARALKASTGTSCRYALSHLRRFIRHLYLHPGLLQVFRTESPWKTSLDKKTPLRIPFRYLIAAVFTDSMYYDDDNCIANLYKPTRMNANRHLPTVVKMRVLEVLNREPRCQVSDIINSLGLYGIPAELVIDSLNYLHKKERLLIWFSTNYALDMTVEDLKQYCVISEHGLGYYWELIGDFEYVWFCAAYIISRGVYDDEMRFSKKLEQYRRMLRDVGDTEWKQLCYRACCPSFQPPTYSLQGEMLVLHLLYSSLRHAFEGTRIAITQNWDRQGTYFKKINAVLESLLKQLDHWQNRYRAYYGSCGYTLTYEKPIAELRSYMEQLLPTAWLSDTTKSMVRELLQGWDECTPSDDQIEINEEVSHLPHDDMITFIARYGRAIPGLKDMYVGLDRNVNANIKIDQFLIQCSMLSRLMEERLPAYNEVVDLLAEVVSSAEDAIQAHEGIAATAMIKLRWLEDEHLRLRNWQLELERAELAYEKNRPAEMLIEYAWDRVSQNKWAMNKIMQIYAKIARRFGSEQHEHLNTRWR